MPAGPSKIKASGTLDIADAKHTSPEAGAAALLMLDPKAPSARRAFNPEPPPMAKNTQSKSASGKAAGAKTPETEVQDAKTRRKAPLATPTRLGSNATRDIEGAMNALLADTFALYLKTKNFHWHVSGPHFRDYHLMLDEQAAQILATTDDMAERVRKIGGTTLRSIGHIARLQRLADNDADFVEPLDMLAELRQDNLDMVVRMKEVHDLCDDHDDVASESLLENWIDDAERRAWFLFEASRGLSSGH